MACNVPVGSFVGVGWCLDVGWSTHFTLATIDDFAKTAGRAAVAKSSATHSKVVARRE
jgi:hypothetical protein